MSDNINTYYRYIGMYVHMYVDVMRQNVWMGSMHINA